MEQQKTRLNLMAGCIFMLAGLINLFSPAKSLAMMWFGISIMFFALWWKVRRAN